MRKVVRLDRARPATWQEALQQFLWRKQAEGRSERTLDDYRRHVARFFTKHPEAWQPEKVRAAVLEYVGEPAKPAYFNLKLVYLRAFLSWCREEGIFSENPLAGIKRRKADGRAVNIDRETLQKLLALPDTRTFAGLRDRALLLLTLDCGIRPKEAFSLLPEDVNLRALEVYVRGEAAKTRIARSLPISPPTARALADLLAARHPAWPDTAPVFCTEDGRPMGRFSWNDRLKKYGKALGVKLTPYMLRHAFAVEFLRQGGNAFALQRILGHADMQMTRRYVNLLRDDIKEQHALASPVNALLPQRHRVRKVRRDR